MDSLYSPTTHSFSLIPRFPTSSSSSLSSSSIRVSGSLCRVRNEFLYGGDCRRLRVRSRRKCRMLTGFRSVPSGGLMRLEASLPVVAVVAVVAAAAVTVSAFAVVYGKFYSSKRKKVSGRPVSSNNQQARDTSMRSFNSSMDVEHLHVESLKESNYAFQEVGDTTDNDNSGRVQLSYLDPSVTSIDALGIEGTDLPDTDLIELGVIASALTEKSEEIGLSLTLASPESPPRHTEQSESGLEKDLNTIEMKDNGSLLLDTAQVTDKNHQESKHVHDEHQLQEADLDVMPPIHTVEMRDAVSILVDTIPVKDNNPEESSSEHDDVRLEETDLNVLSPAPTDERKDAESVLVDTAPVEDISHEETSRDNERFPLQSTVNGERTSSAREDLFSLIEDKSVLDYPGPEVLHGISALSSEALLLEDNSVPTITKDPVPDTLHAHHSSAAGIAGHMTVASHVGGAIRDRKELWKKGSPRSDTRDSSSSHVHQKSPDVPGTYEIQVNGKHNASSRMSTYNRLLRSGRLNECVELLEDMNRKDLLDMSKIYHAKFFDICRSKKAVKEAFRFVKLIPNPTLSTFNMLMSVCSSAQDSEGAFEAWRLVKEAGFKADCKLYTTLISTCGKSGKVDTMFEVFHEMVSGGIEPNVHTYGALIDGCARAGQVAKAFGVYGNLRSKNVKPDRVVFNALITACGQSGAVERAFDVVEAMRDEAHLIDPDHVTVGALIRACTRAGQVDKVRGVYEMVGKYNIKGTPELYTIAINSCSQTGDWEFACNVYDDMKKKGVIPDEMFFSALIDAAGHAGKLDAAFEVLQDAREQGMNPGTISYSSLMGACSKTRNWEKALELYEQIKAMKLTPSVSTVNALVTALCDAGQNEKAMDVFSEMKGLGLRPNEITYSVLLGGSEKNDDIEAGVALFSQAKEDGVPFSLPMSKSFIRMCSRRFEKASNLGEPVLSFQPGRPQIDNKWTSLALMTYRDVIGAGLIPPADMLSQVLGCLHLPQDMSLKKRLTEDLGINTETSRSANLSSLIDGFGEYDPRAFSLFEEAASLGIVQGVSFKQNPIVIDVRNLNIHIAQVYILTVLKGLKHRLAAGARLSSITISLPVETAEISYPNGEKTINVSGRINQAVGALFRRLRLPYQGNESHGKIKISGLSVKRWLQPKLVPLVSGKHAQLGLFQLGLAKGISHQQRSIRTGNLSFD